MNKYILVGFLGLLFSINAFSKDEVFAVDGKNIKVTDFSNLMGAGETLNLSSLKNGVFIMVSNGPDIDTHLPNAEKSIQDVFRAHGIKVADIMENSSVAIRWSSNLSLDMFKADQAAMHSSLPNRQQASSMIGQIAGAAMSGPAGLVGFAAGALFNTDSKLLLQAASFKDPKIGKVGLFGVKGILSSESKSHSAKIFYNLEKGNEASDDIVLKMAIDQWIKHFIVFDVPSEIQPETTNIATAEQVVPVPATVNVPSSSMESTPAITQ